LKWRRSYLHTEADKYRILAILGHSSNINIVGAKSRKSAKARISLETSADPSGQLQCHTKVEEVFRQYCRLLLSPLCILRDFSVCLADFQGTVPAVLSLSLALKLLEVALPTHKAGQMQGIAPLNCSLSLNQRLLGNLMSKLFTVCPVTRFYLWNIVDMTLAF
jgi:hypothetical protein